jgi:hypothetical protein
MENAEKFFETYCDFVTKVTSDPSLNIEDLKNPLIAFKITQLLMLRGY